MLDVRVKEHKNAVKKDDMNNGISVHANSTMHNLIWDSSARILEIENNYKKRKFKESLHISACSRTNSLMNLDKGLQVHSSWITCI